MGVLEDLQRKYGNSIVFRYGDADHLETDPIEFVSTGSLELDIALGGGWARGRLHCLAGEEYAGKTTVGLIAIAHSQVVHPEKYNAIIDLEQSFNPDWAIKLGVDIEKLHVIQPNNLPGERVYEMLEMMLKSGEYNIILFDSVDSLVTSDEIDCTDWEKAQRVGGTSRLNSFAMRKLVSTGTLQRSGTVLVFIQQLRDKIGGFSPYGTPTTTTGGRSLRHNFTTKLEIKKGEMKSTGSGASLKVFGGEIKARVTKNKTGAPFKTATLTIYFDSGLDRIGELVSVAKKLNVLTGTSWLVLNDVNNEPMVREDGTPYKWHGSQKVIDDLQADLGLYDLMYGVVDSVLRGGGA